MNTIATVRVPIQGDGTGLKRVEQSTFDLIGVSASSGTLHYVPDPDNDDNTIVWIRGAIPGTIVNVGFIYAE